jgi:AraC-like DNA-binding protein
LSFRAWRQQVRLLGALERLAAGQAVTTVAWELGYESPSAFGAMFRRALGTTPGRYFASEVSRGGPAGETPGDRDRPGRRAFSLPASHGERLNPDPIS